MMRWITYLLMGVLLVGVASAADSFVSRDIVGSRFVRGGEEVRVELNVSIVDGSDYYLLFEVVPEGWNITGSDGDYSNPSYVVWYSLWDAVNTTHYYTMMAPEGAFVRLGLFYGMCGFQYTLPGEVRGENGVIYGG